VLLSLTYIFEFFLTHFSVTFGDWVKSCVDTVEIEGIPLLFKRKEPPLQGLAKITARSAALASLDSLFWTYRVAIERRRVGNKGHTQL